MLNEAQLRAVALFFYFSLQDEKLARQASSKSISLLVSKLKTSGHSSEQLNPALVSITKKVWDSFKKSIRNTQSAVSYEGGWILPQGMDLGAWRKFRKESLEEEFLIVIWSSILKLSDEDISQGLGMTVGTVRHRVGRGLKRLGSMVSHKGQVSADV